MPVKVAEVVQEYWGGRAAQMYDSISYIDREKMRNTLLNHLNVGKDGVILDFGTGPGPLALMLAESGYKRIIGLDINKDMLGVAREKLSDHPVRLVRGDGLHLPIDSDSVDDCREDLSTRRSKRACCVDEIAIDTLDACNRVIEHWKEGTEEYQYDW